MNKQEATEFILQELTYNRAPTEIAKQLAASLNAPYEAIERFVLQVAAQRPAAPPSAPAAALVAPAPAIALQPASSAPEKKSYPPLPVAHTPPAELEEPAAAEKKSAYPPLPTAHTQPAEPAPEPWETKAPKKKDLLKDEELVAEVKRRVIKGQNRNDIITMVCERAGASWAQAQRVVAQVEVDNYQPLAFKRNLPVFIGSIISGITGIALMTVGLIAAAPYLAMLTGTSITVPPALSNIRFRLDSAFGMVLAGGGMVLGCIVGIYYALQEHRL